MTAYLKLPYQRSFSANCTCRAVVEVLVIAPAVPDSPEGVKTIRLGVLKLARFSRLKISARNCKLRRSWRVVLIAEKSHVARLGPVRLFRGNDQKAKRPPINGAKLLLWK